MARGQNRWQHRVGALGVLAVFVATASAHALEIRNADLSTPRYAADLTRAYAPCLAPNDQTSDGVPACSPAVTSSCTFNRGSIQLAPRSNTPETRLEVSVRDISGPSPCPTGTYTLELGLRVTADDPVCAGGQCTYEDLVVSLALDFNPPNDLELQNVVVETLLPGGLIGAHYEILGATIIAPDGLPMAASGIGTNTAGSFLTNLGAGYEACVGPSTSGALGDACSPPIWPSSCDTNGGVIRWRDARRRGPALDPSVTGLAGPSPDCADGTYVVRSLLRITTSPCLVGALCTTVDYPVALSVGAKNGKLDDDQILLSSTGVFSTPITSMEVREVRVFDPAGATFATSAVSGAVRLRKPKLTLAHHDLLDPNDDFLRLEAELPNVAIDPTESPGVTFTVTDRNSPVYEVTIPGQLWQLVEPIGTRWEFADPSGGIGGVRKISIKQIKAGGEPAGYKIKLVAKDVDLSAGDLPGVNLLITIPQPGGFAVTTAQRNRTCRGGLRTAQCR